MAILRVIHAVDRVNVVQLSQLHFQAVKGGPQILGTPRASKRYASFDTPMAAYLELPTRRAFQSTRLGLQMQIIRPNFALQSAH
jgi:hypothetical protein